MDLLDDVVVKLQLLELLHTFQVVDDPNIFVRQLQMLQVPDDRFFLLPLLVDQEDVVLLIILNGIVPYERVVDDRRLNSLLVLLVVGLGLEDLADVLRQLLDVLVLHLYFVSVV